MSNVEQWTGDFMSKLSWMLCAGALALVSIPSAAIAAGVVEMQILPNGTVIAVNVAGQSEFCVDPQDRSTCRQLRRRCDFVVVNPATRQITEPERISAEAVIALGGPDAFALSQEEKFEELLPGFQEGGNCLVKSVKAETLLERADQDPPERENGSPE
jgi:hypothetical protein